jgi:AcrR family transcriptional regulator
MTVGMFRCVRCVAVSHHVASLSIHFVSVKSPCLHTVFVYISNVPKLWSETIDAHRREVRDAILSTTVALVAEHGLASVTMSQIAEGAGIGRATLYKYFPDIEAILVASHERKVAGHLEHLAAVRDRSGSARERLANVLEAYALISHESAQHHGSEISEIAARIHRDDGGDRGHDHRGAHAAHAREHLGAFVRELLTDAAATGDVRSDIAPDELATYCLHALSGATSLPSKAAVRRLVAVTLAGLRPVR